MSFLAEIKRRKVFRVAAAYAIVAWLLIQVVAAVEAPLNLPDWTDTLAIVLIAIGFPLVVVLGWAFDITPQGLVRTASSAPDATHVQAEKLTAPYAAAPVRKLLPNSVAVLPFVNLSPDPDDAYFAAGIHEEVLSYLTKIRDVSVIARTTVQRYAGTGKSIGEIARELGVGTVMEGSVRYAGERVRVAAQLIDAATEDYLWSDVYERNLADVFAIQADIAAHIAGALEAEFTSNERRSIDALPTTNSNRAHALFLHAQSLVAEGDTIISGTTSPRVRASIQSHLDRSIELDPGFAAPYALKALLCVVSRIYDPIESADWPRRSAELAEAAGVNAERALTLNADLGTAHFALAFHHHVNWRGAEANAAYDRALALRPNDASILSCRSTLKWLEADYAAAIKLGRSAVSLDPGNPLAYLYLGLVLNAAGQREESLITFEASRALHPGSSLPYLATAMPNIALGREGAALDAVKLADRLVPREAAPGLHVNIAYGYGRLGQREDARRVVDSIKATAGTLFVDPIIWACAHLALGEPGPALEWLDQAVRRPECRQAVFARIHVKDNSWLDPVLERPEFLAAREGLRLTAAAE